jgi:hypothetical protein
MARFGIPPLIGSVPDDLSGPGYPWRDGDTLYAADLNAAIALAETMPVPIPPIPPGPPGAIGDGVADDTAAIQAAVNALATSGGRVYLPPGTYRITSQINLPPRVSVTGAGPASRVAPSMAGQAAFSIVSTTVTDTDTVICELQIAPTAANCVGVTATLCNYLRLCCLTLTGCAGGSIVLDRCAYYGVNDIFVRSSMSFPGGIVWCQSSAWNSVSGGVLGGNGTLTRVRFSPMTGSAFGQAMPTCILLTSQPNTSITQCSLAWGAYGGGPISFIVLENQCQGNVVSGNTCLGVYSGVTLRVGTMTNAVMPSYITIEDNVVDSFGGIGILVSATAGQPSIGNIISGCSVTEPQRMAATAAVAAGGSGYAVGDVLSGPVPAAVQQGAAVILNVTAVSSGAVTAATIYNAGLTQTPPTNPVGFTGGGGTGATFNLTYSAANACVWLAHAPFSSIRGCFMESYSGVATGDGIALQSMTDAQITDNNITGLAAGVFCLDANCARLLIGMNDLLGNTTAFGGAAPTTSRLQDNLGVPWLTTTPAMPASGVAVTNAAPYPQQVFITGGTVQNIIYLGDPVADTTSAGSIILTIRPEHTIAITYTAAPTWVWVPML